MASYKCKTYRSSKGSFKLYINGYSFNKNRQTNNRFYWVCERLKKDGCSSRVITLLDKVSNEHSVVRIFEHNHDPQPAKYETAAIIDKIKSEALENLDLKTCDILQICKNHDPSVLVNLPSTSALRQIAYREKQKTKARFTEPLDVYFKMQHEHLQINEKDFVIADEIFGDGKRIVILSTLDSIVHLANSKLWVLDSSFNLNGVFKQLFVIHGLLSDDGKETYPLVYTFCSHKDIETYKAMFDAIIDYTAENEIDIVLDNVIMDLNEAALHALSMTFLDISINTCFFQLGQSIYRHIHEENKSVEFGTDISFSIEMKCLLSLAFLEVHDIPWYYNRLLETCLADALTIVKNFGRDYVIGDDEQPPKFPPNLWSIAENQMELYLFEISAEVWHHKLNLIIDKHNSSFYSLSSEILKECLRISADLKMPSDVSMPRIVKAYELQQDKIKGIIQKRNDYSECEFLKAIACNLSLRKQIT